MCRQNAGSDPVDLLWAQCDLTDRLLSTLTSFSSSLSVISSRRPRPLRKYRRFDTWLKTMAELLAQWFLLQYRRVLKPLPLWMLLDIWENSQATCASKRCSTQVACLFFLSLSRKKNTHIHTGQTVCCSGWWTPEKKKKSGIWWWLRALFPARSQAELLLICPAWLFFSFFFLLPASSRRVFRVFFFFRGRQWKRCARRDSVARSGLKTVRVVQHCSSAASAARCRFDFSLSLLDTLSLNSSDTRCHVGKSGFYARRALKTVTFQTFHFHFVLFLCVVSLAAQRHTFTQLFPKSSQMFRSCVYQLNVRHASRGAGPAPGLSSATR